MELIQGIIVKAIAGFYYVEAGEKIIECKSRGIFRKSGISPIVGDYVKIFVDENSKGVIEELLPRKNCLERPPVANIDRLFIVSSAAEPRPNTLVIDRLMAIAEDNGIEPVIVINKNDLADASWLKEIYETTGVETIMVCCKTGDGIEELKEKLIGHLNVFTGNSGVGKSSILNLIDSRLGIPTGEISEKLGRGKHTTRHTQLYKISNGGYVADTAGFSSIDMEKANFICKENLQFAFREFLPYIGSCKFCSCSHTCEKGCVICKEVENGIIHKSRHENYITLYKEAEEIKDWERKK